MAINLDTTGHAAAVTGLSSLLWLEPVKEMSEFAGIVAPIFVVLWMAVQIWAKIIQVRRGRD